MLRAAANDTGFNLRLREVARVETDHARRGDPADGCLRPNPRLTTLGGSRSCATAVTPPGGARVPADFAAILEKATREDPKERYENMEAMLADLRRFLAREPICANPPSPLRRFRLFARRNPLAAIGIVAAALLLAAFVAALTVGYMRTTRALAEAERARVQTEQALAETHQEAAQAAQSLATALVTVERGESDPRDAELRRALEFAERLNARFPNDKTILEAIETLKKARDAHSKLPIRPRRHRRMDTPKL